jgi:aryl-phospho-beta-D-glucosidase BglC (GH1 family)
MRFSNMIWLCLFITVQSSAQGFLKASGGKIVDGSNREVLLRGMGLGGWMLQEPYMLQLSGTAIAQHDIKQKITEAVGAERAAKFYEAWLANHCRKSDIDSMAAWGFNSVRLPMHYNLFTLPLEMEPDSTRNTWLEKGFIMTDSLLSWCQANRIYLILDLHAAPGGQGNDNAISDRDPKKPSLWQSAANQQKTVELWRKLAERYANEPWIGGYDLINETNWGFTDPADKNGCAEKENIPLKQLLTRITSAIREVDKNHIIYLEANCWANNYNGIFPLWDNNMVVSFHKYWNPNDQASIQKFIDIRKQYNVPVWMGESGENSNVWFTDAIGLLEKNDIGWAWWPLKKLGFNNPMQVKNNEGYQRLQQYWKTKQNKPSEEEAFAALMQLAEDLKTENNTMHKDVVDAMFRQHTSDRTVPFSNHVINEQATVYATDYDLGKKGFAYADNDDATYHVATGKHVAWNKGHVYRNDGVDIQPCTDSITNGFNVGWTEKGEWLQYTILVEKAGKFDLHIRAASSDSSGAIQLMFNGVPFKQVTLPVTGGSQRWTTLVVKDVPLAKGSNRFRVLVIKGGANLNYFQFFPKGKANKSSIAKRSF